MKKDKQDNNDFDMWADDYQKVFEKKLTVSGAESDYFFKYKIDEIARIVDFTPRNVLDFGCGVGSSCRYFVDMYPNIEYYGIDNSEKSIQVAQTSEGYSSENISFQPYDGITIPFPNDFFEIVYCAVVMHHITEKHAQINVIKEMTRVLKPGGLIFIFEHNPYNPMTRIVFNNPMDKDALMLTAKKCRALFENHTNIADLKTQYTLFFPRHKLFTPFLNLEKYLYKIPFGAQYYVCGKK